MELFLKSLGLRFHNMGGCYGIDKWVGSGEKMHSINPATGESIAEISLVTAKEYSLIRDASKDAFASWKKLPAPKRGDIIRKIGDEIRDNAKPLAKLISLEMGKVLEEARGEVQEAIDMAYYASGLARQPYGKIIASERASHTIQEHWHPRGIVGIITSFNFPIAVWSWNSMIATVCGNTCIWKPSSKVPLCSLAMQHIVNGVLSDNGWENGVMSLCIGRGSTAGAWIANDRSIPLVSATGSVAMGKSVSEAVCSRSARAILELGGNNGAIVTQNADIGLAAKAIVFGAVGTTGQRCTTTRRVIAHESIKEELVARIIRSYRSMAVGNPLECGIAIGPLVDSGAVQSMADALESAKEQGGTVIYGGKHLEKAFVEPAIVEVPGNVDIVKKETFAPILYVMGYEAFEDALDLLRDVPQGLASSLFSKDIGEIEAYLASGGSDCGIANVNTGTSGAEISGAFGGEKDTGGGREAGSDAWKEYMWRQTVTINWGKDLPLSQGIDFSY